MIVVVITARPSYARVKTVLEGLEVRGLETLVLVAASGVITRYGRVADVIAADGFHVQEVPALVDGNTLETGALTTGLLIGPLSRAFADLHPHLVVTIADRKETLATSIAAAYQHIPLMHLLGDEHSGSIDEKVRAANRALADYHHETYTMGCPSVDLALRAHTTPAITSTDELGGVGSRLALTRPFVLCMQHAVSGEAAEPQMDITIEALRHVPLPVLCFWPGEEAGAERMAKRLRMLREEARGQEAWHFVINLAPGVFYRVLLQSACIVGNSSVGIREAGALGVPCVDIGSRQRGRRAGVNVLTVPHRTDLIAETIQRQIAHGPYPPSTLYGTGSAGSQIAEWIHRIVAVS